MAEETLYCPSCNRKVRVPEELLGQPVQCPLCRLVFTAPLRGEQPPTTVVPAPLQQPPAVPPPTYGQPLPPPQSVQPPILDPAQRSAAEQLLRTPGILMLVTGVLGVVYNLVRGIGTRAGGPEEVARQVEMQQEIFERFGLQLPPFFTADNLYVMLLIMFCVFLVARLFTVFAGVQMLRARGYGMAITGTIVSLIPCLDCPCCLLCPPVALWALIVLLRSDVRGLFH